ncbi:interleukin-3 receptor subunit alpha [Phascolarctos cinereus]|uniref:Interleukin-3 receptor subunit alpha n=1 Tax=Phascolarctos cinereus TaxID=38626 RepID=A0A6P5KSC2_PHACI|nr:interleukin-3 receptor subunit alpha [Phascolarctos cinereus]
MADLITFIWFSMLLTVTYSQTPTPEDSPIKNITLDMKTMFLRWTNVENVNNISCSVKVLSKLEYRIPAEKNECELKPDYPWCQGVDFEIEGFAGKRFLETFQIPRRGKEGTTEESLSCQVHDANLMDCKWTVRETLRDIQYQFFYSQNANAFADRECPKYKTDSEGRHVGCHFDNLSGFTELEGYHFLVTGTSSGREVQCNDKYIELSKIEIFKPPNININCTNITCSIQWQIPKRRELWETSFEYQLQIQKVADKNILESGGPVTTKETNFDFKITDGKYTVKIRTRKLFENAPWSEWSEPQEFGHEVHRDIPLSVLMFSLLGIAFIILLILGYLCKRYYVIQKIFPPVPRIKDQVSDSFHQYNEVLWEENKILPEQCKIEEIQVIGKK